MTPKQTSEYDPNIYLPPFVTKHSIDSVSQSEDQFRPWSHQGQSHQESSSSITRSNCTWSSTSYTLRCIHASNSETLDHVMLLISRVKDKRRISSLMKILEKEFPLPNSLKGLKRIRKRDNEVELLIHATSNEIKMEMKSKVSDINEPSLKRMRYDCNKDAVSSLSTKNQASLESSELESLSSSENHKYPPSNMTLSFEKEDALPNTFASERSNYAIQSNLQSVNQVYEFLPSQIQDRLLKYNIAIDEIIRFPNRLPCTLSEFYKWKKEYQWEEMNVSHLFAVDKLDREIFQSYTNESKDYYEKRMHSHYNQWLYYVQQQMNRSPLAFCAIIDKDGKLMGEAWDESPPRAQVYYTDDEINLLNRESISPTEGEKSCQPKSEMHEKSTDFQPNPSETTDLQTERNDKRTGTDNQTKNQPRILPMLDGNPLCHACIQCIDQVARRQKADPNPKKDTYLCTGYTAICSHEPCVMCAMALLHSRVKCLFYFKRNPKGGIREYNIHEHRSLNHHYRTYEVSVSQSNSQRK